MNEQIADGMAKHPTDVVIFEMRALVGYVNRWLPCREVMLQVAPTGEAELVVRHEPVGMELKASEDGVHDPVEPAGETHYRAALEATRDALADSNALDEAIDSPANRAFAIINHALAASPRKVR